MKRNLLIIQKSFTLRKIVPVILLVLIFNYGNTQTFIERQQIQKQGSKKRLDSLRTAFDATFKLEQKAISQYILKHPETKKVFVKDGKVYILKKIRKDGTPLYITTRSNRESGKMIGAESLYPGGSVGADVIGTDMIVGIWDGGLVRETHELLAGKVEMQAGQTVNVLEGNNHMTHVSGTIVGKELAHRTFARGVAYGAKSKNWDSENDNAEMTAFAANGYLISNHSYGYLNDKSVKVWNFGAYDEESLAWDVIVKNAPGMHYLPFVAVGNEQTKEDQGNPEKGGFDLITGSSASKNVMTVGAVDKNGLMTDYSNWGPTDDGRFKPEIVARGSGINSAQYPTNESYSGEVESDGTSYAAPAAAAMGVLLQQYYKKVTNNYMKSSTLRALMMHTATDLGNAGPDYKFGYGLVNGEKAGMFIKNAMGNGSGARLTEYNTNPANNGEDEMVTTVVANGNTPLKVSIAWVDDEGTEQTDAEGIDPTTGRLVYNFDIAVRSTNPATETRPWRPMGMEDRNETAKKGSGWFEMDNNNYREVVIEEPVAGATYSIAIRKSKESPEDIRPFSLIVSGTKTTTLPIKLVYVSASSAGASNQVKWETSIEEPNTEFILQRSDDGSNFTTIATLKGNGKPSTYVYTDKNSLQSISYYRIKTKEVTGNTIFSRIVAVRRNNESKISVTPTPASHTVRITNTKNAINGTTAFITDIQGKVVKKFLLQTVQHIDISNLNAGMYFLKTVDGSLKILKK